jgi:hypothetical protein
MDLKIETVDFRGRILGPTSPQSKGMAEKITDICWREIGCRHLSLLHLLCGLFNGLFAQSQVRELR